MKILVVSYHNINDNRINKHLNTISRFAEHVHYVNISDSKRQNLTVRENCSVEQIPVNVTKKNPFGIIWAFLKVRRIIRNSNANIIHIHDPLLIVLLPYAKSRKMTTVYDKHESYELYGGLHGRISNYLENTYHKKIDGVVYVNSNQELYLNTFAYRKRLIPNFQVKAQFSSAVEKSSSPITLIYIGTLTESSRATLLMLDMIEAILSTRSGVNCVIGGPVNDSRIDERLEALSNKFETFSYLGYVPYNELIELTCKSDIGLYFQKDRPNNIGSSPNKIFEYLLSGLAVVSIGRFEHWDKIDSVAGRVFDFDPPLSDLVTFVQGLVDNPALLRKFKNGSKALGEQFTWESVEGRYRELYEELFDASSSTEK